MIPDILFCVTFCHNVTSDLMGGCSDLEPRVFFYCTLLHVLRDLLPGRSLGRSPLRRHPFFMRLFATIQHPAHPICQYAVLIWDTSALLGFLKSRHRQQALFSYALSRILRNPAAGRLFFVQLFSAFLHLGSRSFLCNFLQGFAIFQITGPLLCLPHKCRNVSDLV